MLATEGDAIWFACRLREFVASECAELEARADDDVAGRDSAERTAGLDFGIGKRASTKDLGLGSSFAVLCEKGQGFLWHDSRSGHLSVLNSPYRGT